jgi:RNA polymerase sigma factor (sigma-70 family)
MKEENVPSCDSEQRLGDAHTRLLLKGARRVLLWALVAAIETVRNEETAAAGAIHSDPALREANIPNNRNRSSRRPKGTEGLVQKKSNLSQYVDGLTEKQQMAISLKYEYELGLEEIASRMGTTRKTAYEHIQAASKKIEQTRSTEKRRAHGSKRTSE